MIFANYNLQRLQNVQEFDFLADVMLRQPCVRASRASPATFFVFLGIPLVGIFLSCLPVKQV